MNYMQIIRTILFISCLLYSGNAREISCSVNPGLNGTIQDQHTNVVHIVSEGEKDVVHYIWSTYKLPSVIVLRTTRNTSLSVNTTKLISFEKDAITFTGQEPLDSVGLTFSQLWELHYPKDVSTIYEFSSVEALGLESLFWTDVNLTLSCSESFASVILRASNNKLPFSKNGTFEIQFSVSAKQELSNEFPHLFFTGNSTLLKVVLNNLHSNSSKSRYGLGVSTFSTLTDECEQYKWDIINSRSINDEFSPGVFTDVGLLAPCSDAGKKSSFIAWRPVAYTGEKPIVANSSDVTIMKNPEIVPAGSIHSIAELYFIDKSNISAFNVTFGTEGDGFYPATLYTSWSLMLGTGRMVHIPLSTSVIYFAAIGVGLVLLFVIGGILFIICRKFRVKDDDLLLNS